MGSPHMQQQQQKKANMVFHKLHSEFISQPRKEWEEKAEIMMQIRKKKNKNKDIEEGGKGVTIERR